MRLSHSEFYNERPLQKVVRRLKEEPLVPIGCLLTVTAFVNAYRATRRGDHHQVQRMFRARVAAQAFTVVAIVAGGAYYSKDRQKQKELWKQQQQHEAEEKRQKWIRELEVRDEEDKALKERLEKRKKRAAERAAARADPEGVVAQARAAFEASKTAKGIGSGEESSLDNSEDGNNNSSILGSLRGLFGRSKPAQDEVPSSPDAEKK